MSYLDLDFHRGLMAALNDAYHEHHDDDPPELRFYRRAIERGGQPALDAGCGAGRLLLPMLRDGFDVEGSDLSPDMLDRRRAKAAKLGLSPTLHEAATGELDPPRRYRTIVMNGSLGVNGTRDDDVDALRRVHELLGPGGTLAFDVGPGWAAGRDVWERAIDPDRLLPTPWTEPSTTPTPEGDAIVDSERLVLVDPLEQRFVKELCIDLIRDGRSRQDRVPSARGALVLARRDDRDPRRHRFRRRARDRRLLRRAGGRRSRRPRVRGQEAVRAG